MSSNEQRQDLRRRAQQKLKHLSEGEVQQLSPHAMQALVQELSIHQIELEMQNDELRSTQMELESARAKYIDLFDFAPVGYFMLNMKGMIREVNLTGCTILGMPRSKVMKKSITAFVMKSHQDTLYHHLRDVASSEAQQTCELLLNVSDGAECYVQMQSVRFADGDGEQICRTVVSDITRRKQAEMLMATTLKEKEILLQEVHHRVKNNLAIISSMLGLQSHRSNNQELKDALLQSQRRIKSMSLVQNQLYMTDNFIDINVKRYIDSLISYLQSSFGLPERNITITSEVEEVKLDISQLIAVGLIVNELITNSLKHAFPPAAEGDSEAGGGLIRIELKSIDEHAVLSFTDNGRGLPHGFDVAVSTTLGFQIILSLATQLGAELELHNSGGASVRLSWLQNVVAKHPRSDC